MPESRVETPDGDASDTSGGSALFRLLLTRGDDAEQVYTAMREIGSMAGATAVQQLTALIQATAAEQNANLQTMGAQLSSRIDSVEKELRRIWAFLFLLLATLLGTLTTLVTTLLLRG